MQLSASVYAAVLNAARLNLVDSPPTTCKDAEKVNNGHI